MVRPPPGSASHYPLCPYTTPFRSSLGEPTTLHTEDHASFQTAWQDFERRQGRSLPRSVAIAIAGPTKGEIIRFTNNPWIIRPALIREKLNVDDYVLVNDFEAVGHAVAQADARYFERLCGPDEPLPATGTISVIGPGTGLGVAHVWRDGDAYRVQGTEGGPVDFAPLDSIEDEILARPRKPHLRVSDSRLSSGPATLTTFWRLGAEGGR